MNEDEIKKSMDNETLIRKIEENQSICDFYGLKNYILVYLKDEDLKSELSSMKDIVQFYSRKDKILEKLKEG